MRVTIVGASTLGVQAARALTERGHEVVVIDQDEERIESLSDELDCGLMVGDGSRPAVLAEVGPKQSDVLFCVSNRDEANILGALVGRSLGFGRVVPKVEDPQLEPICTELGLDDVIVPDREVAMQLVDMVEGRNAPELSAVVRSGVRFFAFKVPEGVNNGEALALPDGVSLVARTRGNESVLAQLDTSLEEGDEVVVIAEEGRVDELRERFSLGGKRADEADDEGKASGK